MTLQNIFSSMANFRDVVSVLPAARLIKAIRIFVALQKSGIFSLIYFFKPFWYITVCIIMSFRKPYRMPFRKLVPSLTLTGFDVREGLLCAR